VTDARPVLRVALTVLVLVLVAPACSTGQATVTIDPDAAAELIAGEDVVVLDIRTPDEFAAGIVAGAVNIDFYADDFAAQLAALDRDASYVVYCRSGNRTVQAMQTFADLGFSDVSEIAGGILGWQASGLPLVAP